MRQADPHCFEALPFDSPTAHAPVPSPPPHTPSSPADFPPLLSAAAAAPAAGEGQQQGMVLLRQYQKAVLKGKAARGEAVRLGAQLRGMSGKVAKRKRAAAALRSGQGAGGWGGGMQGAALWCLCGWGESVQVSWQAC